MSDLNAAGRWAGGPVATAVAAAVGNADFAGELGYSQLSEWRLLDRGPLVEEVISAVDMVGPWSSEAPSLLADAYALTTGREVHLRAELAALCAALDTPEVGTHRWLWWGEHIERIGQGLRPGTGWSTGPWPRWVTTGLMEPDVAETWAVVNDYITDVRVWSVEPVVPSHQYKIDSPADWVALVRAFPIDTTERYATQWSWELSPPRIHEPGLDWLLGTPGQTAATLQPARPITPDWAAVAREYDVIEVTWAGAIRTEGRVTPLGDGAVTIMRGMPTAMDIWLQPVLEPVAPADRGHLGPPLPPEILDAQREHLRTLISPP